MHLVSWKIDKATWNHTSCIMINACASTIDIGARKEWLFSVLKKHVGWCICLNSRKEKHGLVYNVHSRSGFSLTSGSWECWDDEGLLLRSNSVLIKSQHCYREDSEEWFVGFVVEWGAKNMFENGHGRTPCTRAHKLCGWMRRVLSTPRFCLGNDFKTQKVSMSGSDRNGGVMRLS